MGSERGGSERGGGWWEREAGEVGATGMQARRAREGRPNRDAMREQMERAMQELQGGKRDVGIRCECEVLSLHPFNTSPKSHGALLKSGLC